MRRVKGANNLVKVAAQNETDVVVAQYKFFGDDRRASKAVTNRGDLDATTYFFYDGQEIVEERDASENLVQQYIYGPNHIDEPVMIRGTNGTYFVYTDANWNVIGLTTPGGRLAEEYNYTPYGRLIAKRHTAFGDNYADGDVDEADQTAFNAAYDTSEGEPGWNRNFDADYDGDVDSFDLTAFLNNYNADSPSVEVSGRAWSPNGNDYTYTARRLDPESMLMHYRRRAYSPTLKQFMQRDPLRYVDGPNLYQYVRGNPMRYVDPSGRVCEAQRQRLTLLTIAWDHAQDQMSDARKANSNAERAVRPAQEQLARARENLAYEKQKQENLDTFVDSSKKAKAYEAIAKGLDAMANGYTGLDAAQDRYDDNNFKVVLSDEVRASLFRVYDAERAVGAALNNLKRLQDIYALTNQSYRTAVRVFGDVFWPMWYARFDLQLCLEIAEFHGQGTEETAREIDALRSRDIRDWPPSGCD